MIIDNLKKNLYNKRYDKDFSFQFTGKELRLLLDYLSDLETSVTELSSSVSSQAITFHTANFSFGSYDFTTIDSLGIPVNIPGATTIIILGGYLSFNDVPPDRPFDTIGNPYTLYLSPDLSPSQLGNFGKEYLKDVAVGDYLREQMFQVTDGTGLSLYSEAAPSIPATPVDIALQVTYLKIG